MTKKTRESALADAERNMTIDDLAERLGMSPDDLRELLIEKGWLRQIADGPYARWVPTQAAIDAGWLTEHVGELAGMAAAGCSPLRNAELDDMARTIDRLVRDAGAQFSVMDRAHIEMFDVFAIAAGPELDPPKLIAELFGRRPRQEWKRAVVVIISVLFTKAQATGVKFSSLRKAARECAAMAEGQRLGISGIGHLPPDASTLR